MKRRLHRGGNSHDRRIFRRAQDHIWEKTFPKFQEGEVVVIRSASYGQRYENSRVTVLGKGQGYGTYLCQSNRRKAPLAIHGDHLERSEEKKAA